METGMKVALALFAGAVLGAAALFFALESREPNRPDVETVAAASLEAVRAQNRLTVLAGRFTVAVSSRAERLGLSAEKTMIVPATVRYDVDYSKLTHENLRWDAAERTLYVGVPDVELSAPQVDLDRVREYSDGQLLMALGNAREALDRANRAKVDDAVLEEADTAFMRGLARDAARSAVERGFTIPLEAAGIAAKVVVRFEDEAGAAL